MRHITPINLTENTPPVVPTLCRAMGGTPARWATNTVEYDTCWACMWMAEKINHAEEHIRDNRATAWRIN